MGPTAIGKTHLAIALALHYKTELISADSRQFYKEMSIGTAKPGYDDLHKVPQHFVDFISVTEDLPAGEFASSVDELLADFFKSNEVCIMAGGSGLFVQAVCDGLDDIPEAPEELRNRLNQEYEQSGIDGIRQQLKDLDPEHYGVIDLQNHRRIIRALEVCLHTGKPYSSFLQKTKKQRDYGVVKVGLEMDRDKLYKKIEDRVDAMMESGLEEEVRSLVQYKGNNALNTVGYKEMFEYIDGKATLEEAVGLIKRNTRRFAKRQLTWFKRDDEIKWFDQVRLRNLKALSIKLSPDLDSKSSIS